MSPAEELEKIYIQIGENKISCSDEVLAEIDRLENIVNPRESKVLEDEVENWEPVCGSSICNGKSCWDCAAIRGGCPEDV